MARNLPPAALKETRGIDDPKSDAVSRFHRLRSLQIEGGFLDGCTFEFADQLNCLIGGRGTGKTTVLELIRWVLDQPSTQNGRGKEAEKLEKLIKTNLGSGVARAKIETADGAVYLVEREVGREPRIYDQRGEPAEFSLRNGTIFAADAYSQNEIEQIADEPRFQLRLLDRFIEAEVRAIDGEIAAVKHKVGINAGEVERARREAAELKDQVGELPDVNEKLKAFTVSGTSPAAGELQREQTCEVQRRQEADACKQIDQILTEKRARVETFRRELTSAFNGLFHADTIAGPNADLIKGVRDALKRVTADFGRALDEAGGILRDGHGEIAKATQDLKRRHDVQEKRYREILSQHEQESGRARERAALVARQADLLAKQKRLEAKEREVVEREKGRKELIDTLSRLRDQRFQLRAETAHWLTGMLGPMIRVRVDQSGDPSDYQAVLSEALKGSGIRYGSAIDKIVERISPPELAAIIAADDRKGFEARLGLDADRAGRILGQLQASGLVNAIEVAEMADRPVIELRDGNDYKDSASVSTGQKCTTILPLLLLRSKRPLLIDQPEDNLDNAFIYETVVKSLLKIEGRRQLLFASHNPNLIVLGGTSRVFVLESTGERAEVKVSGNVDEVRGDIETLLEGGSEAFQLRKQRYGY